MRDCAIFAFSPLAVVVMGGLITSTLLTLVVVPVLYSYLVREKKPAPAPAPAPDGGGPVLGAAMPADRD